MLPYIPYMDPMGHKFPWKISPTKPRFHHQPGSRFGPGGHKGWCLAMGISCHGVLGLWKKAIVMGYIMLYPNLWSISWDIYIYIYIYSVYTLIAHKKNVTFCWLWLSSMYSKKLTDPTTRPRLHSEVTGGVI